MFTGWTPKPIIADTPPAISGKFHRLFIPVHAGGVTTPRIPWPN